MRSDSDVGATPTIQLTELLKDKNTSIARLRKLLFGSQTEKTNAVVGNGKDSQSPPPQAVAASTPETATGFGNGR